ncbi:inositol polyphosphate kinase [Holotrichia oblita]|uniref:Inositol polyphosphate kinase n=1 Tax=Holotrichia oblita TaxID=644536 RepID=A0ACB9SV76_HOLOL|nr:inositol polyphosphate kinase [Holotrichia oblita]
MGKSKVDSMRPARLQLRSDNRKVRDFYIGGSDNNNNENDVKRKQHLDGQYPTLLPPNMELFNNQVAGHMQDGVNLGMIKSKSRVYKPITKEACGRREIGFYEDLKNSRDPILQELKQYVPKYYGTEVLTVDGKQVNYIVLDDVTRDFKEPCVMDIKIGRRTYDPLASYEKIIKEDQKYHETKRDLGFCIPGFQVFRIANGRISKYGKDYGKNLNKETVIDAFKIFLNANSGLNRTLIMQLLTSLWRIQNWARKQRQLRLYSSSLLLVYDARRLRHTLNNQQPTNQTQPINELPKQRPTLKRVNSLNRPISVAFTDKSGPSRNTFSGLLTKDGPILGAPASPTRIKQFSPLPDRKTAPPSLKRMHSFQNNYDKDLQCMKTDYVDILDQLVNTRTSQMWATVKIIDFAHVFPAENCEQDRNFLEGVENLVKIFEAFLMETDPNLNGINYNVNGSTGMR